LQLPQLRRRAQRSAGFVRAHAVLAGGERGWVLLNASPDLRQQLAATPELAPRADGGLRSSPIVAVVLTNGDVDHVAGLLSLREGLAFNLYASTRVLDALAANSIFNVLNPQAVRRVALALGQAIEVAGALVVEPYAVPGKVALYLEGAGPAFGTREGDSIGLKVSDPATGAAFHYIPGCAAVDADLGRRLKGAPLVLFDGTLYTDDEMIAQGLSDKTGTRMGHISMAGPEGSMAAFAALDVERRIYVHMNNSNPVLREDGPERAVVERAGWEVAYDGMEIRLP
jgi:pyrroloquinoline quinone biosynthesis protein B